MSRSESRSRGRPPTRRGLLAGAATAVAAALAGCSSLTPFVGKRLEETEVVDPAGARTLAVDGALGDVAVRPGDRDDVHVDVVKQSSGVTADLEALQFRTERQDGHLRLYSEWTGDDSWFGGRPEMTLDVAVPRSIAVETIRTSTGVVTVTDTSGDLAVTTNTGSIDVTEVDGDVDASASNGSIDLERVAGTVTAAASNGSITVREPGRVGDLDTTTGSIDADVPALDGDVAITASTGSVTAALAPELDVDLRVSTTTGSITVGDVGLDTERREADRVAGRLNDGGQRLTVETTTGSVRIERLS